MARKLVSKYVFMKNKGQAVSGYESWKRKIIDRIHNVSVSVKCKEMNESSDAPVSKRGRQKSTTLASHYPSLQHDFSDDTSFNRNIDKIKSEMCMSNPRKQVLLKLMEDTYARRREMVLGKQGFVSVPHVLELYPCLKMYSILNQEVSLVLDKDVLMPGLESRKSTWVSAIINSLSHSNLKLWFKQDNNTRKHMGMMKNAMKS
uniref:Uncharacterized protein n=1 Tax=Amphimedon queenslandica TaxID=400682 RepID=A0A1X7T9E3_AMPQE